jgi:hypothetical protein
MPPPAPLPFPGLPTLPAPPTPAPRNSRGLRADSSRAEQWLSNDQRWNGQWTLRPPDNLTRSRATTTAGDEAIAAAAAGSSSSPAAAPAPKRKKKRRPATADAQAEPSTSRTASAPSTGQSRPTGTAPSTSTAVTAPSPRLRPPTTSSPAAPIPPTTGSLPALFEEPSASEAGLSQRRAPSGRVRAPSMSISRSQRSRLQTGDVLSRGASMRRRNVQEGALAGPVAPAATRPSTDVSPVSLAEMNAADDSDLTPALPPPSYAYSLTIPVHRPAGEPPPARPMSPPNPPPEEAPPPGYQPPASARPPSDSLADAVPRSPPPTFSIISLPRLLEAAPPGATADEDAAEPSTIDEASPTEQQRLWDLWSARGVGLGERVVRMRAFQAGVLVLDEEDRAEQSQEAARYRLAASHPEPPISIGADLAAPVSSLGPKASTPPPAANDVVLPSSSATGPRLSASDAPTLAAPPPATELDVMPRPRTQPVPANAQASPSRIPRPIRTPVRIEASGRPSPTAGSFPGAGRSLCSPSNPIVERPVGPSQRVADLTQRPNARP